MSRTALAAVVAMGGCAAAAADTFVPFVIPARPARDSLIVLPPSAPIRADGERLIARDGHFFRGARRVRIWGVNVCFGANFPTHEDADAVAARLAGFGINSVRFHHMDSTGFPRGIWDKADPTKLSAEALDRLDYFIDRLARRGIWSNLNLHVSRTHSRVLKLRGGDKLRPYDKIVDLFTPALIDAQKRYARDLLAHVNRYRKLRYADDPAVAFVEITNEDSFFMWGGERTLASLPPYYAGILQGLYAAWLRRRYTTTGKLRAAWAEGAEPLGANALAPLERPGRRWRLEQHGQAAAKAVRAGSGLRVEIARTDGTDWHVQLNQPGVTLTAGRYYTLSFRARADRARRIGYNVGQAHRPWNMLGLVRAANLTKQWQAFRAGFTATGTDDNARVSFILGGDRGGVEIEAVELRPGGRIGLGAGEGLEGGNVALFGGGETRPRTIDRLRFLAETEKGYFDAMRAFLKDELGYKGLVTGTIVFGPLGLFAQSGMDYIDGHAYWQHPRFPGRPWDPGNWTVEQKAMVDHPDQSPLWRLAAQRLAGKPYTVSEYNHPAPNDYQAECVPMVASFAAAQDWDGVWLFAYNHRTGEWDRQHFSGFFDICANPAKWGFVPAGTIIFREAGIEPAKVRRTVTLGRLDELLRLHGESGRDLASVVSARLKSRRPLDWKNVRVAVALSADRPPGPEAAASRPSGPLQWFQFGLKQTWMFAATGPMAEVAVGDVPDDTPWIFARASPFARVMAALDGKPLHDSRRILITLCGRCENTGMKFSTDRRTVGRNWGRAPVRIQPSYEEPFGLPGKWPRGFKCLALKPDGTAAETVPIAGRGDEWIDLLPKHKTMWYLLKRD